MKRIFFTVSLIFIISKLLTAQSDVQLESNLEVKGQIVIGQDDALTPVQGSIRFDTMTHTFQGFDGAVWIDLGSSGVDVNSRPDTLKVGDSFGGGIVFFTAGPHGLVVADFDLAIPSNPIEQTIIWGDATEDIGADSRSNGRQNTTDIVASLQNFNNGDYGAKIADDLDSGGFSDWYMPSIDEFILMNDNVGTGASGDLNNIANLETGVYWTSTEFSAQNGHYYHVGQQDERTNVSKDATFSVRAIRAY